MANKPWEKQTVEERIRTLGGVPESDLRDLVEEMRNEAEYRAGFEGGPMLHEFADRLESVIGSNSEDN